MSKLPLWDWTHGITQSSMGKFLECREQFALHYVEGWTPRGFSVPLEFGTMIHAAIERYGKAQGNTTPEEVIDEVTTSYSSARLAQLRFQEDKLALSKTIAAAQALFPSYVRAVARDDAHQKWISHEQVFDVPHEFPLGQRGTASVRLRGMRDGTYRTNKRNCLGLFETKTKSQIDDKNIESTLRADLQTLFYLHTLRLETGEVPKQVLYNVIRRPGQVLGKHESYKSYQQRIVSDVAKRPEWYFRRWEVNVVASDLDKFVTRTLNPILLQMLSWWESVKQDPFSRWTSPYHWQNLNALSTKYGNCPLYALMVLGRKDLYFVRSSPFPELPTGPSTSRRPRRKRSTAA